MDEDNNDAPRVTRARTRRLSTLDTDSRSSTPLIDATVERASPRPTRRTRLNSTTIDLRTPTRSTRLSVARGETPEPITSSVSLSATKRTLKTPAKSVRKQLALKEEVEVPDEDKDGKNNEPSKTKVDVVTEEALDSTRNTSNSSVARGETPESITPSVSLAATKRTLRTPAKSVRKQLPLKEEVEVPDEDKDGKNNEPSKTMVDVVTEEALDSTRNTSNSSDIILTPKVTPPTDSSRVVTRSMSKTPPVSMRSPINHSQPQSDTNNSIEEKQKQTNNTPVMEQQSLQSQSQSKLDDVWKKDIPIKAGLNNRASVKLQVKVKNISMDTPVLQKITKEEMQIEQQDSLPDSQSKEISSTKLIEKTQESADESQNKDKEISKLQTEEEETPMSIQALTKTSAVTHAEPVMITDNIKKGESLPTEESKTEIVVPGGDVLPDAKDVDMESPKSQTEYITPMSVPETKVDDNTEQNKEQVVTDEKDVSMESCSDSQAEYETPKSIQEEKTNINNNKESVSDKAELVKDKENEVIEAAAAKDKSMELPVDALPTQDRKSIVKIVDDLRLPNLTPDTKSRMIDKIQLDAKKVDFQGSAKADNDAKPKFPKTPARLTTTPLMALNALSDDKIDLAETPQKLIMLKKRNSSTPLAKPAEIENESSSVPRAPPQQIDVIKSLSDLEPKAAPVVQVTEKKLARRLVSEDEDEEEEDEYAACEYFDNEVEVVEDYKSGDSMDSSERREIEENEIPHDGESVGSQDTVEDNSEDDEVGSLSSFIVSDGADHDDVDNDCENDDDDDEDDKDCENDDDDDDHEVDDDDIGELCFSSEDASVDSDVKNNKKRRRIIVHESSEEEEQKEENNNKNKHHSTGESTKNQNNSINEKKTNKLHQSIEISKNDENAPIEPEDDMEVEEVPSSSEEDVEQFIGMRIKLSNKSIYEIPDSSDESQEENEDKSSTTTASTQQLTDESDKQSPLIEEPTSHEQSPTSLEDIASPEQETTSVEVDSPEVASTEETAVTEGEADIPETVDQSPESQNKQKHNDDEAALLSELASCDLSHLQKMFNPLQKSRRQTLYVKGPEMSGTEPKTKLKRRSEQYDSDFKPSQSFIETLSKETSQRLKRKHISKSFCGTTDDLDTSVVQEGQSKKPKKEPVNVENVEPVETKADNLEDQPTKPEDVAKKLSDLTKDNDYYINYCDALLQKANAAALEQKKLRIATGKKPKSLPTAAKVVIEDVKIPPQGNEIAQDAEKLPKLKKNVKRLQATKQAVKHAMQLLGPDLANKEPQSLARKLSPQPQLDIKNAKTEVKKRFDKTKKPKAVAQVSPVKSSDEENHHSMKCIKTSAGYVVISKAESNRIELIKTRSGIMKVEPSTPIHKYFKEVPLTLRSRSGLSEMAVSSKAIKKKPISANHGNSTRNPATESALRFKKEILGRAAK